MKSLIVPLILLIAVQTVAANTIVVTIPDFRPIAKAIAGDDFEVVSLIPPGSDPHAFTLSVEDVEKLRGADLIVLANSKFFDFEAKIAKEFSNVVDFDDYNPKLLDFPGYPSNLHGYWMLPENAVKIAKAIKDRLAEKYPNNRDYFEKNYEIFVDRVEEALKESRQIASEEEGKEYVAMVPGVCYTASSLGIKIGAVVISEGAGIASGKELQEIKRGLESGKYSGIILPEFMKGSRGEEIAKELVEGSNAKIAWVKFSVGDTAYDVLVISNAARIAYAAGECEGGSRVLVYLLSAVAVLEALLIAFVMVRR